MNEVTLARGDTQRRLTTGSLLKQNYAEIGPGVTSSVRQTGRAIDRSGFIAPAHLLPGTALGAG